MIFPLLRHLPERRDDWILERFRCRGVLVARLSGRVAGGSTGLGKLLADLGDTDLDAAFPPDAVQSFRNVLAAQLRPHPDERLSAFSRLLKAYGFEKTAPVYDVLSGFPSLSLEGAQEFFRDQDDVTRLSRQPLNGEAAPCEVICLGMQFDTMLAYDELLASKPGSADLAAIAKDHDLSVVLAIRKPQRST